MSDQAFEEVVSEIASSEQDPGSSAELFLRLKKLELENEKLKLQLELVKQNMELRSNFANWTREIVTAWIVFLGASLLFLAVYRGISGEKLFSDWILVTLLGTSTATIIGLPLVIIKGLFLDDKKDGDHSSSTNSSDDSST